MDIQSLSTVECLDACPALTLRCSAIGDALDHAAVRALEQESGRVVGMHLETALVDQAMVGMTKLHQIVEACCSPVGPVLHVVSLDEVPRGTAGEYATAVA